TFPSPSVFSCLSQLSSLRRWASGTESGRKTVVLPCLFQLASARGREVVPERLWASAGYSNWRVPFRPTRSLFHPPSSILHRAHSVFHLTPPRVRPFPLSVERVVVQRRNLVFGRSKWL